MDLSVHFTLEEKLSFLRKRGYKVTERTETMSYPIYHNDMETSFVKVLAVSKNGKDYMKPGGYTFGREEWVDNVFEEEIEKKLKQFLLKTK